MRDRDLTLTRYLIEGSLLCSTVIAVLLLFQTVSLSRITVLFSLVVIGIASWHLTGFLYRSKRPYEWLLCLCIINLFIVMPELSLRLMNFKYLSRIEFGFPRTASFEFLVPDEKLLWRLPSSLDDVNSLGFHGDEIDVSNPESTYSILYLGDSCTDYGFPRNYPAIAESLLNSKLSPYANSFKSIVLALGGYSSHQGRMLAEMYGREFEPDLVVVFFGWNDHWLARGAIDAEKAIRTSKWTNLYNRLSHGSRLLQGFIKFSVFLRYGNTEGLLDEVRVPIHSYRENLLDIADVFRETGTPIIFMTAPTAHYDLGVPDYLVELGYARNKSEVIAWHQRYNAVVRAIAEESGSSLLDLESRFNSMENLEQLFISDGIHSTPAGLRLIAEYLATLVVDEVLPQRDEESPWEKL